MLRDRKLCMHQYTAEAARLYTSIMRYGYRHSNEIFTYIMHTYGTCKKSQTSLTCITKLARINIIYYVITSHWKEKKNLKKKKPFTVLVK